MTDISKFSRTKKNQIIVRQDNAAYTLGGTIDSTIQYFIDGIVDCSGFSIDVPADGIGIAGYSFELSKLICTDTSYTMFTSPLGGSGNVLISNIAIEVSGASSRVYGLFSNTGDQAIEHQLVNWNNCTSMGSLDNFRQGLEIGTGRFGGSPSLELIGAWAGGYRVSTSIARNLSALMTEPIFKAGLGFVMSSRFLTDINCDLPALAPLMDFSDASFPNPSTLELRGTIVTRDGLFVPNDANLTPNIEASNLSSSWKGNIGTPNTFVGGISTVSAEVLTTIVAQGVAATLQGTQVLTDLQHFDSPSNGQLRHLGTNPREYTANFDFVLEGGSNEEYRIELVKNDGSPTVVYTQIRVINNLAGGRDVAYFTGLANVILNQNDFVFWQVVCVTGTDNCTLELNSSYSIEER